MSIKIYGIRDVINDIQKMDLAVRKAKGRAIKKGTDKLRDAIRQAAPKDSGLLKRSINSRVKHYANNTVSSAYVGMDADAQYWIPLEFGHSNGIGGKPVPPKPFVYNTRDRVLPGILDEIENEIDGTIGHFTKIDLGS